MTDPKQKAPEGVVSATNAGGNLLNARFSPKKHSNPLKIKATHWEKIHLPGVGKATTLRTIVKTIRDGSNGLEERIRLVRAATDKDIRKKRKKDLPSFNLGIFANNIRNAESFESSQAMLFDVDGMPERSNAETLRGQLAEDSRIILAFISPSGNGVKFAIKLPEPIGNSEEFAAKYKAFAAKLSLEFGIELDKTSDCCRACFFSHDPEIHFNPDAMPYNTPLIEPAPPGDAFIIEDFTAVSARKALEALNPNRADEYNDWLSVGSAIKAAGLTVAEWDEWSRKSPKYDPGSCATKWDKLPLEQNTQKLLMMARNDTSGCKYTGNAAALKQRFDQSDQWDEDPLPWPDERAPKSFPVEALPDSLRRAIKAAAAITQTPIGLAATSIMAGLSAAAQAVADVVFNYPGHKLCWPISEYWLTLAKSGERKTALDKLVREPFNIYEAELAASTKTERAVAQADNSAWHERVEGLKAKIRAAVKTDDRQAEHAARDAMAEHEAVKPPPPLDPGLLVGADWNRESLLRDLSRWPIVAAISAEAGTGLAGYSVARDNRRATFAALCGFYDGQHEGKRRIGESAAAGTCRMTISFAMQPAAWRDITADHGGLAAGVGLLPRLLVSEPESGIGRCKYQPPPTGARETIADYQNRLLSVLRCSSMPSRNELGGAEIKPPPLPMSADASNLLFEYMLDVEPRMAGGGDMEALTGHGRRLVEHAARIAAAIELYSTRGTSTTVSAQCASAGIAVAEYFAGEAVRLCTSAAIESTRDARKLETWMIRRGGNCVASRSEVLKYSPIRTKERLNSALKELIGMSRARMIKVGTKKIQCRPPANPANPANFSTAAPPDISKISDISIPSR